MTARHTILRKIHKFAVSKPPRFWLILAGLVLALLGFREVIDDVFYDPAEGDFEAKELDELVARFVQGWRSPRLTQVMTDITALGSVSVITTLFLIFISILASYRDYKGLTFISTVMLGAGLWPTLLKIYFARARPEDGTWLVNVTNYSFPSGHSFGSAAAYVGFSYYAGLHARTFGQEVFFFCLGATLAMLVGISRIYLGVHYTTDVMAGLCGGVAWGLIACAAYELLARVPRDIPR